MTRRPIKKSAYCGESLPGSEAISDVRAPGSAPIQKAASHLVGLVGKLQVAGLPSLALRMLACTTPFLSSIEQQETEAKPESSLASEISTARLAMIMSPLLSKKFHLCSRSQEHRSELQSRLQLVSRLLL